MNTPTKIAIAIIAQAVLALGCGDDPQMLAPGNFANAPTKLPSLATKPVTNPNTTPRAANDTQSTNTGGTTAAGGAKCDNGTTCAAGQACVSGTNMCVKNGAFRITLSWTAPKDIDLHVATPRNEEVYYRYRDTSDGGKFSQDGCIQGRCEAESSPFAESVVWSDFATAGTYEMWVINYDGGEAIPFTLEVEFEGQKEVFNGTVGSSAGAKSNIFAYTIEGAATNPNSDTQCKQTLDRLGVPYRAWNYSTQSAGGKSCSVDEPITITGPINGVTYQYLDTNPGTMNMTCDMAVALHRLGDVLKEKNINKVKHIGTFNCRKIAGSNSLSQHSYGNAIDLWEFVGTNGTNYSLERDFEKGVASPKTHKGQVLQYIGKQMHERRIFNIVLTPNFNKDHRNHFHVDLKAGQHTLRQTIDPEYFYDESPFGENCPGHE